MSWFALLGFAAVSYGLKALGPVVLGPRQIPENWRTVVALAAVPMLAALIALQTVSDGDRLVVDARLPALGVAALLVWRKAPFPVVVLAAAATAALLRT